LNTNKYKLRLKIK